MNVKQQGISGYWLKLIAVISMLIDHTSAVILEQIPGLEAPAFFMRIIGRAAFPIYCFLLVEGFYHTRSRAKYAGRLFLFALISEVPFDLAFSRRMWDFSSNNVFFTLLFGLLVIWGVEGIKQKFATNGGKLHVMAFHNVFRDKKRAILVFMSLFMGITMILGVNGVISSMSAENFIKEYMDYNFEYNDIQFEQPEQLNKEVPQFDEHFVEQIKQIDGVENVDIQKTVWAGIDFDETA